MTSSNLSQLRAPLSVASVEHLEINDALHKIASLVNLSSDNNSAEGAKHALRWVKQVKRRKPPPLAGVQLEYFASNAWAVTAPQKGTPRDAAWAWKQPALQQQIFHLRLARRHPGFEKLTPLGKCQIHTNLANALDSLGRFVEAQENWNRALTLVPQFGMALGNRGLGLRSYARALYDPGHTFVVARAAYDSLQKALDAEATYQGPYVDAKRTYAAARDHLKQKLSEHPTKHFSLDDFDLGRSKEEREHRRWCLRERLFLNPLNDVGEHSIAAKDVLHLPSYVTKIGEPPSYSGLFNQLKQEFVAARLLLYEGLHSDRVHFADRHVLIYNTLDYPVHSLAVEKVKASYRAAYSIFDKIAFFLNAYLRLGVPDKQITFRKLWKANPEDRRSPLRPEFEGLENWTLRGLYWLSKDFFEEGFRDVVDPDANALSQIRNQLEHGYLKVHDPLYAALGPQPPNMFHDPLAYHVERGDFERKALRLLKLARSGLIYLSLGMHAEERRRQDQLPDARPLAGQNLSIYPEGNKR